MALKNEAQIRELCEEIREAKAVYETIDQKRQEALGILTTLRQRRAFLVQDALAEMAGSEWWDGVKNLAIAHGKAEE